MASISESRPPASSAMSHPYSCNSCQVAFRNNDLQKSHMKSDWHRYNLKRRVASLPPISSEVFTEKVLQARAATTAEADKAGFEKACDVCQKTYYSENSYQNHVGSQKHKARAAAAQRRTGGTRDDEASSVMSSTFSLGEPVSTNNDDDEVLGSDAEEEFNQVVEGLQKTGLDDRSSPVKRPSNPHLSAAGQHKADHPVSATPSDNQSASATPSETPTPSTTAASAAADLKKCLFCSYPSPSLRLNVTHMERIHGMFIPEKQYLVDLDGLIGALQQRVQELHECLYCGRIKANVFAVQTHMRDKGHCKIPYTTEDEQIEIGEFYDFRSTYSDGGVDSEDDDESAGAAQNGNGGGGAKLGARRTTTVRNEDGDVIMGDGDNNDGWETDSSASSLDSADLTAVPMEQHYHQYERLDRHPHHSRDDPRAHHQRDGWHSHAHKHNHAVFYDEYELHLPSGKSVGHRSLNRYYRQNLHSHPSPAERAEQEERLAIEAAAAEDEGDGDAMSIDGGGQLTRRDDGPPERGSRAVVTRANGGLGMLGVTDQKKDEARRAEQKARSLKDFSTRRNEWSVNKQANHQKYYHYSIL